MQAGDASSNGQEDKVIGRQPIGADTASRVRQAMHVGRGRIHDLAWSPDGQTLAVATAAGIWVYNLAAPDAAPRLFEGPATGAMTQVWWRHGGSIMGASAVAISPDGGLVAGAFSDGSIWTWDMASGQEKLVASASSSIPHRILFDNSGKQLIVGGERPVIVDGYEHRAGVVHIGDLGSGNDMVDVQVDSWVVDVALDPGGTSIVFATFDGTIYFYDLKQQRRVASHSFPMGAVYSLNLGTAHIGLAMTAEGIVVVVRPEDERMEGFVCRWHPEAPDDMHPVDLPQRHSLPALSPDGRILAWSPDDRIPVGDVREDGDIVVWDWRSGETVVWDWRSGETVATLHGAQGRCPVMSFSPDGQMLAANDAHALRVWRIDDPDSLYLSFNGHSESIWTVLVDKDATTAIATNHDHISIYTWDGWQVVGPPLQLTHPRPSIALSSRGMLACVVGGRDTTAAGENDDSVWLYDVARQREAGRLPHHRVGFASGRVAFSPDGRLLAVCGGHLDRSVALWDVNTMTRRAVLGGHNWLVHKVVFSPDGCWLASTGPKSTLLWNVETGALHMPLPVVDGLVAFSPDSRLLATHGYWQPDAPVAIHLWDVQSGSLARALIGVRYRGYEAAFSSDGRFLATEYEYNLAQLLNVATGTLHVRVANSGDFTFSPDGTVLATTNPWGGVPRIFLWSVATGALLRTLTGHRAHHISALAFSGDGTLLVSGADDGILRFWQVDPSAA